MYVTVSKQRWDAKRALGLAPVRIISPIWSIWTRVQILLRRPQRPSYGKPLALEPLGSRGDELQLRPVTGSGTTTLGSSSGFST